MHRKGTGNGKAQDSAKTRTRLHVAEEREGGVQAALQVVLRPPLAA